MNLRSTTTKAVRDGAVIAVAMGVMNVTTYAFTILAARLLGPAEYGALAAVIGMVLIVNVLSLGLQATGARRVSAVPTDRIAIEHDVMSAGYRSSAALGLLTLLASPVIAVLLHLDSWLVPAMVAVTAVPLTVMGAQAGILQGERRWGPLAGIYLAVGLGRLGFGALGLLVERNTLGAMVGVALGAAVPVVIGAAALRHPGRRPGPDRPARVRRDRSERWAEGGVLREVGHNSHALLAFFALSNVDVVTARITLDEHQAGLYAGGLILAKAVLFLPQFIVVLAFPSMASSESRDSARRNSLLLVLAIGSVTVVGVAVLHRIAVEFVGGSAYAEIGSLLWAFAALGTLLAMLQIMVYDAVARQHRRAVYLVWAALLAVLCAIPFVSTVTEWLTVVAVADASALLLLMATLRPSRDETAEASEDAAAVR
ncbi:MAG TPA: oligosaccharide flippase family protein [Gaiellales bacterium]|nr:oligosaccharide flippase family protein [Gaiellales bacterium]